MSSRKRSRHVSRISYAFRNATFAAFEFTGELEGGKWFTQSHMFRHDYAALLAPHAKLLDRFPTALQIQPAVKEVFLFEKRRSQ